MKRYIVNFRKQGFWMNVKRKTYNINWFIFSYV